MKLESLPTESNFMHGAMVCSSLANHSIATVAKVDGKWVWYTAVILQEDCVPGYKWFQPTYILDDKHDQSEVDAWFEAQELKRAIPITTITNRGGRL